MKKLLDKIIGSLIVYGILGIFGGIIIFADYNMSKARKKEIEFINKDFKHTKAIVTVITYQKSLHTFWFDYKLNNRTYDNFVRLGYNDESQPKIGDSINIRYATTAPEFSISELEYGY